MTPTDERLKEIREWWRSGPVGMLSIDDTGYLLDLVDNLQEASEWQPIESAPKSPLSTTFNEDYLMGPQIELTNGKDTLTGRWWEPLDDRSTAMVSGFWRPIRDATHWRQPLPAPPQAQEVADA